MPSSYDIHEILAIIRDGDFAHPGAQDAIHLALDRIPKNDNQLLLDIGCGRGGTADYVQHFGWGRVIGVDLDQKRIEYAQKTYPSIKFYFSDVSSLDKIIKEKVNIFFLFNSFYEFKDQTKALKVMNKIAAPNSILIIFDYVAKSQKLEGDNSSPINLSKIEKMLDGSDWSINQIINLDNQYEAWYSSFLKKAKKKQKQIVKTFDSEAYSYVINKYSKMLEDIKNNLLGGAIIYAKKKNDV